jgi:hypothetical protein
MWIRPSDARSDADRTESLSPLDILRVNGTVPGLAIPATCPT